MYRRPAAILWLAIIILMCAISSRAAAQQSSTGSKAADDASVETGAANKATASAARTQPAASPSMEERLRALEEILERQQREIQALRELVEKREVAAAGGPAKKSSQVEMEKVELARAETARVEPEQAEPAADGKAQDDVSRKRLDELYRKFGSLRISGDIRFRAETFNNQGFDSPNELPFRDRLRIRARLALDGVINEHFDWGLRLATGVRTDVNSTNQTLTDFFERKEFTLDRAFIRYDSKGERVGMQLVAGRFEPTFRRTQMVWDEDVNVEGASEAIYFKTGSSLRQIKLVAFQLPFDEEPSAKDGVLYGGQLQTDWQLSPTVSAGFNVAHYNWNRPDLILRAIVPFAGSGTSDGQVITVATTNTVIRDANGRPIGFLPNFNLFDILGTLR
ncbi:MAG TPA: putative porin, partial [Blastocatellia bacterium]|nr:putative porin [Blastocatellia bacterium]